MLPLEEMQLPRHVAGGERIVSCYHHYLRGKREGSKSQFGVGEQHFTASFLWDGKISAQRGCC